MPLTPQMNDFLSCPVCFNSFSYLRKPITLTCSHTCCSSCLKSLQCCPFDQTAINSRLPENEAILGLVVSSSSGESITRENGLSYKYDTEFGISREDIKHYRNVIDNIKQLALLLKPQHQQNTPLSRPMQRKLITLLHCQTVHDEGRARAMRNTRSIGERALAELLIKHQDSHQLSCNLWAAVRARGCQFLGPAMQEEVLRLVLLALEDGSALSRKVLVMFVVQRLSPHFPHQASKTAIGHVIQLLYRASCFKLTKREGDSSLMQLKEEYCSYDALRREHDTQIVSIALEAGLRISPDQWSSLLYGDTAHKSHMQSIIDKLQSPSSFNQSIQELVIALQRTGDPANLSPLKQYFERLADIDPSPNSEAIPPTFQELAEALEAAQMVTFRLLDFLQQFGAANSNSVSGRRGNRYPNNQNFGQKVGRVGRVKPFAQSNYQSNSPNRQMSQLQHPALPSPTHSNIQRNRPCASVQPTRIANAPSISPSETLSAKPMPIAPPAAVSALPVLVGPGAPTPCNSAAAAAVAPPTATILPTPRLTGTGPPLVAPPTLPSEEDQFIPFADQPFVSKYGPISRIMSVFNTPTIAAPGMSPRMSQPTNVILGRTAVPSLTLIHPLQQLVLTTTILEPPNQQFGNSFVPDPFGNNNSSLDNCSSETSQPN